MNKFNLIVEFSVDGNLDHKAPISQCIGTEKKSFNSELIAIDFINECTYVYDLETIKKKLNPVNASQIKDKVSNINKLINH